MKIKDFYRAILICCTITLFLVPFSSAVFAEKKEVTEISEIAEISAVSDNKINFNKDSIFVDLAIPDSLTGARVIVNQSPAIEYLTLNSTFGDARSAKGFRIQIFSSNRGETARTNAFKIEKELLAKNPQLPVYVIYESPFWKVRIGNCITHPMAQELRLWVMEQYPKYQTETYIVPSQILY